MAWCDANFFDSTERTLLVGPCVVIHPFCSHGVCGYVTSACNVLIIIMCAVPGPCGHW